MRPQTHVLQASDLLAMELILLDHLAWRTLSPTSHAFLHLYATVLPETASSTLHMAAFLTVRLLPVRMLQIWPGSSALRVGCSLCRARHGVNRHKAHHAWWCYAISSTANPYSFAPHNCRSYRCSSTTLCRLRPRLWLPLHCSWHMC